MGATSAIERSRKEDLLDQKPQLIDDGKRLHYRVGNKLISTDIASPKATGKPLSEYQRRRLEQIDERERRLAGGRGAPGQIETTNRFHMRQLQKQLQTSLGDNPDMNDPDVIAKTRQAIENYNKMWGTNFNVPEAPPTPPAGTAKPSGGWWNWITQALTGSSAPAKAEEKPAEPAAPATPAPQTQQQGQQGAAADPIAQGQQLRARIQGGQMTRDQAIAQARAAIQNGASRAWVLRMLQEAGITLQ